MRLARMPEYLTPRTETRAFLETPYPEDVKDLAIQIYALGTVCYSRDIDWSEARRPPQTMYDVLPEYVWVVYTSGFNATIVHKKWSDLLSAWANFRNPTAQVIYANKVLANQQKNAAIYHTLKLAHAMGSKAFLAKYCMTIDDLAQ